MTSRSLIAAFACLAASHAAALLTRPDRDDAEYLELASRYTSSVRLGAQGGEGVLIAPRWVLTSAERARGVSKLRFGPRDVTVVAAHVESPTGVALLLLKDPVEEVDPTPIYRGRDEAGKGVVITGHGGDGRKRAGINVVEALHARTFELRVKKGDDASDLQGALAPEETGAPAYLQVNDELFVAGIATQVAGDRQTYARISALVDWIDDTMFRAGAEEARAVAPRRR